MLRARLLALNRAAAYDERLHLSCPGNCPPSASLAICASGVARLNRPCPALYVSSQRSFHVSTRRQEIRLARLGSFSVASLPPAERKAAELRKPFPEYRHLLSISGRDTFHLLQELVTRDVSGLQKQWEQQRNAHSQQRAQTHQHEAPDAFYCAFLHEDGKLLAPVSIYPHPNPPETDEGVPHVLIDFHVGHASLQGHMEKYKLERRLQVDIRPLANPAWGTGARGPAREGWQIWAAWHDDGLDLDLADPAASADTEHYALRMWKDPRSPAMGYRFLVLPSGRVNHQAEPGPDADEQAIYPATISAISSLIRRIEPSAGMRHIVCDTACPSHLGNVCLSKRTWTCQAASRPARPPTLEEGRR